MAKVGGNLSGIEVRMDLAMRLTVAKRPSTLWIPDRCSDLSDGISERFQGLARSLLPPG
jgi:hypothetical protein